MLVLKIQLEAIEKQYPTHHLYILQFQEITSDRVQEFKSSEGNSERQEANRRIDCATIQMIYLELSLEYINEYSGV